VSLDVQGWIVVLIDRTGRQDDVDAHHRGTASPQWASFEGTALQTGGASDRARGIVLAPKVIVIRRDDGVRESSVRPTRGWQKQQRVKTLSMCLMFPLLAERRRSGVLAQRRSAAMLAVGARWWGCRAC
jgi:hypothetical protein